MPFLRESGFALRASFVLSHDVRHRDHLLGEVMPVRRGGSSGSVEPPPNSDLTRFVELFKSYKYRNPSASKGFRPLAPVGGGGASAPPNPLAARRSSYPPPHSQIRTPPNPSLLTGMGEVDNSLLGRVSFVLSHDVRHKARSLGPLKLQALQQIKARYRPCLPAKCSAVSFPRKTCFKVWH